MAKINGTAKWIMWGIGIYITLILAGATVATRELDKKSDRNMVELKFNHIDEKLDSIIEQLNEVKKVRTGEKQIE